MSRRAERRHAILRIPCVMPALLALTLLAACTRTTTTTQTTTTPEGEVKAESPLEACTSDADCGSDEYCRYALGACEGTGSCERRPEICTKEFRPVCGCDGATYSNPCGAAAAGVSLRSEERCDSDG